MFPATRTTRGDSLECAMSPNDEPTIGLDVEATCAFKGRIEAATSAHHRFTITRKD